MSTRRRRRCREKGPSAASFLEGRGDRDEPIQSHGRGRTRVVLYKICRLFHMFNFRVQIGPEEEEE